MKAASAILTALVALSGLCGLYGVGYWLFIKRDLVSSLLATNDDPFEKSGLQGAVSEAFEPARELDLRHNHDAPLRKRLMGSWRTGSNDDFVSISPTFHCEFRLGRFTYRGPVGYERAYAGFFTEFQQEGQTHIFILSPATGPELKILPEHLADAFVGHDPEPRVRERDYNSRLIKQTEQDGADQPASAPESKSDGTEKLKSESEVRPR